MGKRSVEREAIMCGIAGTNKITEYTQGMVPFLAWEMERRGADSWGMTNGVWVDKWMGEITETWGGASSRIQMGEPLVLHTRAASVGAVAERNSHPWVVRKETGELVGWDEEKHELMGDTKGCLVGVHNGHIRNHAELRVKYPERAAWEVDSSHVFGHMAKGLEDGEIHGWGALVWFDEGVMKLLKFHMQDLSVVVLEEGEVVICSTKGSLVKAARMAGALVAKEVVIEENIEYTIVEGDVIKGERRGFGGAGAARAWYEGLETWRRGIRTADAERGSTRVGYGSTGKTVYATFDRSLCWECQREKNELHRVLCKGCLENVIAAVQKGGPPVWVYRG